MDFRPSRRYLFGFAAIFVVPACSSNPSMGGDAAGELADALVASGRDQNRNDPFFTQEHPQTGSFTLSTGETIPVPVPFYDIDGFVVYGTMDVDAAHGITDGTGYQPWVTDGGRAFAMFEFDVVGDSGNGRYRDASFSVLVSNTGGTVPWVNAYSALVPAFNPTTSLFRVGGVIQGNLALRAYDEYFALQVARAETKVERHPDAMRFSAKEDGDLTACGKLPYIIAPSEQGAAAVGLAAAFGLPSPADLPPNPPELTINFVYRSTACDGCLGSYSVIDKGHVTFRAFDPERDALRFGDSPYGKTLSSYDFQPATVLVNINALDVVELTSTK